MEIKQLEKIVQERCCRRRKYQGRKDTVSYCCSEKVYEEYLTSTYLSIHNIQFVLKLYGMTGTFVRKKKERKGRDIGK